MPFGRKCFYSLIGQQLYQDHIRHLNYILTSLPSKEASKLLWMNLLRAFFWTNWIKHRTAGFSMTKKTCFWVLIFLFSCLDNSLLSYISCSKRLTLFNFHSYSSLLSIQRSLFEFLWIRVFHSLFCKLHRPINCFFIIKRRTNIEWNAL